MKWTSSIIVFLFSSLLWSQDNLKELEKRIKELEKKQNDLLMQVVEPKPQVSSYLKNDLTFGGFYEPAYTVIDGSDTKAQALSSSNIIGLNISADYQSNFRFVSQTLIGLVVPLQNQHNDPNATPARREFTTYTFGAVITQGYIEYARQRTFNLQLGLGYVPFGYANQQRELVLFARRGGPQILRNSSIVAPVWTGLHIHGSKPIRENIVGYNVYTFSPIEEIQTPGVGGRFWILSPEENISAGISTQIGKSEFETTESIGVDLKWDMFPFNLVTEFVQVVSKESDPWSFYVEPGYFWGDEEFLIYLFADYAFNPLNKTRIGTSTRSDPYQKWEYGIGLNWLPTSYTRFRIGLGYHDYVGNTARIQGQERDYYSLDLSAGLAF